MATSRPPMTLRNRFRSCHSAHIVGGRHDRDVLPGDVDAEPEALRVDDGEGLAHERGLLVGDVEEHVVCARASSRGRWPSPRCRAARDVHPGSESHRVRDQRFAQVFRKFVHHPTGHSLAAHACTLAGVLAARRPRSSLVGSEEQDVHADHDGYGDGFLVGSLVSTTCVAFGGATCSETR
jgi:hypothetical protein